MNYRNYEKQNINSTQVKNILIAHLEEIDEDTVVNLAHNKIDDAGAKYLSDVLRNNKHIKKIILTRNEIREDGMWYFRDVIDRVEIENDKELASTSTTDVDEINQDNIVAKNKKLNPFHAVKKRAKKVAKTLKWKGFATKDVDAKKDDLSQEEKDAEDRRILEEKENREQEEFNITLSNIKNNDAEISKLDFSQRDLNYHDCELLSDALKQNNDTITDISLRNTQIKTGRLALILKSLEGKKSITSINLENNQINYNASKVVDGVKQEYYGTSQLCQFLANNTYVHTVNLRNTAIDEIAADIIIDFLKKSKRAITLNISGNNISDQKSEELRSVMRNNEVAIMNDIHRAIISRGRLGQEDNLAPEKSNSSSEEILTRESFLNLKENNPLDSETEDRIHKLVTISNSFSNERLEQMGDLLNFSSDITQEEIAQLHELVDLNRQLTSKDRLQLRESLVVIRSLSAENMEQLHKAADVSMKLEQLDELNVKIEDLKNTNAIHGNQVELKTLNEELEGMKDNLKKMGYINKKVIDTPEVFQEKYYINSKNNLKEYYDIAKSLFNASFTVASTMSKGDFAQSADLPFTVVGGIAALMPPVISGVVSGLNSAASMESQTQKKSKYSYFGELVPGFDPLDVGYVSEMMARKFTIAHEEEIEAVVERANNLADMGIMEKKDNNQKYGVFKGLKEMIKSPVKAIVGDFYSRGLVGKVFSEAELLSLKNFEDAFNYIADKEFQTFFDNKRKASDQDAFRLEIIEKIIEKLVTFKEKRMLKANSKINTNKTDSAQNANFSSIDSKDKNVVDEKVTSVDEKSKIHIDELKKALQEELLTSIKDGVVNELLGNKEDIKKNRQKIKDQNLLNSLDSPEKDLNNDGVKRIFKLQKETIDTLKAENTEMQDGLEALKKENSDIKNSFDLLKSENSEMKNSIEFLIKEFSEMRNSIKSLTEENTELKEMNNELGAMDSETREVIQSEHDNKNVNIENKSADLSEKDKLPSPSTNAQETQNVSHSQKSLNQDVVNYL